MPTPERPTDILQCEPDIIEAHTRNNGRLIASDNGIARLTPRGEVVSELLLVDRTLSNHHNPRVNFAISGEKLESFNSRREELCRVLGMPQDESAKRRIISGLKGVLRRHGLFPYPDLAQKNRR